MGKLSEVSARNGKQVKNNIRDKICETSAVEIKNGGSASRYVQSFRTWCTTSTNDGGRSSFAIQKGIRTTRQGLD